MVVSSPISPDIHVPMRTLTGWSAALEEAYVHVWTASMCAKGGLVPRGHGGTVLLQQTLMATVVDRG